MQKEDNIRIITTGDGSHSLELPGMDETYHSRHGALQESQYVFIQMGIDYFLEHSPEKKSIEILEVGFGTGLNVLLSWMKAESIQKNITLTTLEPFPLKSDIYEKLNYGKLLDKEEQFNIIHSSDWSANNQVGKFFSILKLKTTLEEANLSKNAYDLIFFDAFAPSKQSEVWSLSNLEKCYQSLRSPGVFVTYCAQGQFRRNLLSAGFKVEKLPGPPGKFEMIRGRKKERIE